jgi:hypothetical protein
VLRVASLRLLPQILLRLLLRRFCCFLLLSASLQLLIRLRSASCSTSCSGFWTLPARWRLLAGRADASWCRPAGGSGKLSSAGKVQVAKRANCRGWHSREAGRGLACSARLLAYLPSYSLRACLLGSSLADSLLPSLLLRRACLLIGSAGGGRHASKAEAAGSGSARSRAPSSIPGESPIAHLLHHLQSRVKGQPVGREPGMRFEWPKSTRARVEVRSGLERVLRVLEWRRLRAGALLQQLLWKSGCDSRSHGLRGAQGRIARNAGGARAG